MSRRQGLEAIMAAITEINGDGDEWYSQHPEWPTAEQIVEGAIAQPTAESVRAAEIIQHVVPRLGNAAIGMAAA